MKGLDDSTLIVGETDEAKTAAAKSALDEALTFASNAVYTSWDVLVSNFKNDIYTHAKMQEGHDSDWLTDTNSEGEEVTIVEPGIDKFLKEYCGITLVNEDTGAITGSDAGGETEKTAESIVPETGKLEDLYAPNSSATTIKGLTFHWPKEATDQEQTIINALNEWWAKEGLNLIEESYGLSFMEEGATVTDIDVLFESNAKSSRLAYVTSYDDNIDGKSDRLELTINMHYYDTILDENGKSTKISQYLDRTIAHELTHAVMDANITGCGYLPKYVKEGSADLVHGVDDIRANEILGLTNLTISRIYQIKDDEGNVISERPLSEVRQENLEEAMRFDGDSYHAYAGGYMLLHYFAKQVEDYWNRDSMSQSNGMLASAVAESSASILNVASVQNALLDFADPLISDSLSGIQQDETKKESLFITGNI